MFLEALKCEMIKHFAKSDCILCQSSLFFGECRSTNRSGAKNLRGSGNVVLFRKNLVTEVSFNRGQAASLMNKKQNN